MRTYSPNERDVTLAQIKANTDFHNAGVMAIASGILFEIYEYEFTHIVPFKGLQCTRYCLIREVFLKFMPKESSVTGSKKAVRTHPRSRVRIVILAHAGAVHVNTRLGVV